MKNTLMTDQPDIPAIKSYLLSLQNRLCAMLSAEDDQVVLLEDNWQHDIGGGGITRVLLSDQLIEKAGANFSHVYGMQLPPTATLKRPELTGAVCEALGVSTVVHPKNPYVPTAHMNVRFIRVESEQVQRWWFGGGFDLTPYYGYQEDCVLWHTQAKAACTPYGKEVYPKFKKWCDDYFYLPHRQEARGVGGIFFDDLNEWGFEQCFTFMQSVGNTFLQAYQLIIAKRKSIPYGEQERLFQTYRRGRYVEFNLLYDRGTLFGLQSKGRTESILMSLPPQVAWVYNYQAPKGSKEAAFVDTFLKPRDWIK